MKKYVLLVFSFCAISILSAQSNLNLLFSQGEYAACFEAVDTMNSPDMDDPGYWFFKGACGIQMGKYEKGLYWIEKAEAQKFPVPFAIQSYKARAWAQLDPSKAMKVLDTLHASSSLSLKMLEEKHFQPLELDSRFKEIKEETKRRIFPCQYDANYKKMDFWLGEWDVYANGRWAGHNVISKQPGGCMLMERYTTIRDYVGQSVNYYDTEDGLWKQTWIDNGQNIVQFSELESKPEGYIQFLAPPSVSNARYTRMTFSLEEDGSVRQFIEQSADQKQWTTSFDGRYVRRNQQ